MYVYCQTTHPGTGQPNNRYHCRGIEASQTQVDAFAAMMAKRYGLKVFTSPSWLGDAIAETAPGSGQWIVVKRGPRQATFAPAVAGPAAIAPTPGA